jgi:hypothetical protein
MNKMGDPNGHGEFGHCKNLGYFVVCHDMRKRLLASSEYI